jgi:uncharacterized damage-inducible protein DinB
MTRPRPDEAAGYYFTYIDQAPGNDPVGLLQSQLDEVLALCATITEEQAQHRYAADKWSVRQLLNHVTDTERAFAFRALWFARGFDAPLPGFDQDVAAAGAEADRVCWSAHVDEFRAVRESTLSFFQNLPDSAWDRKGIASEKPFTVRALAYITAGHAAHHIRILRERYLATPRS